MPLLHFIIPFGILILLTVAFRRPLWLAAAVSYGTSICLFFILGSASENLTKGFIQAVFVALEISLVLSGAIFFLNFLKKHHVIDQINESLKGITRHKIPQVLLLAWLFGSFFEGSAGFGTPALIIAPLLSALGFSMHLSVAIPLMADTTAVAFGAVGTPIKIGFAGIELPNIATTVSFLNLCTGFLVPFLIIWILINKDVNVSRTHLKTYFPFALWSGFAFTIPSWLMSFMGPEFPSLIGGLIGLFLIIYSIKYRFLLPKDGEIAYQDKVDVLKFIIAFLPYVGLSLLLILGKYLFNTNHINIPFWEGFERRFYLFQPGMAFFTMPFILIVFFRHTYSWNNLAPSFFQALKSVPKPAVAILFIAAIAQNLVLSNQSFLSPIFLNIPTELAVFLTPFFGALGSFAAGSATVSNLLFGQEINSIANTLQIDNNLMLSLQLIGASIGNAVALQNIAVVQAAIQSHGQEKSLLKILFLPTLVYMIFVGLMGIIFLNF